MDFIYITEVALLVPQGSFIFQNKKGRLYCGLYLAEFGSFIYCVKNKNKNIITL